MRIFLLLSLFILLNCSEKNNNEVNTYLLNNITLFHIKCEDEIYFTTQKCDCNNISKSNLKIIGDNESYYVVSARYNKELNKIQFYSLFNKVTQHGKIGNTIEVIEYKDYVDNVFNNDSIIGNPKFLTFSGTASQY
jgi:hypothetical protein